MSDDCRKCRFAVEEDYGYSNYTVEGTTFKCLLGKHPEGEFDRFYGKDARLLFGATCESREPGEPIEIDVEGEGAPFTDDMGLRRLLVENDLLGSKWLAEQNGPET